LPEGQVRALSKRADSSSGHRVTIDLRQRRIHDGAGFVATFEFDDYRREMLLKGLDEIGMTLLEEPRIAAFERRRAAFTTRDSA
jgi:3-isopropylmalate/(R)-2-methylmalate dehydratase small subunit